jgi:hypothetical protein
VVDARPASSSTKPELIANTRGLVLLRRLIGIRELANRFRSPRSEQSPEPDSNRRPLPYQTSPCMLVAISRLLRQL